MIVTGVPELQQEDLKSVTMEIANKINVGLEKRDILDARRLKSKPTLNTRSVASKYPAPILVYLTNPVYKNQFMEAKKVMGKLFTQQIFSNHQKEEDIINFRSFLTQSNIKLLQQAKLLKDHGFIYIWFSQNKVQVRKGPKSSIIHIKNKSDIDKLIPK